MKQVICINWGTKYGREYINRLYAMVARNITPPFTFTCFTDNPEGIRPEVKTFDLPPLDVKMPTNTWGVWPKARLWSPTLGDLTGPCLFLDLDVVITGSLDAFFTYGEPDDLILARNQTTPLERLGQTSVFRFKVGTLTALLAKFKADPQGVADTYRYEQRFVSRNAPNGMKLFPSSWVRHFRRNCEYPFPLNYVLPGRLPRGTRIVIFPGGLKPEDAVEGTYHTGEPHRGRWGHLKAAFGPERKESFFRHIRHFALPNPWVATYWRE